MLIRVPFKGCEYCVGDFRNLGNCFKLDCDTSSHMFIEESQKLMKKFAEQDEFGRFEDYAEHIFKDLNV